MDNDGRQWSLEELGRVVNGISVQDNQLKGARQLKDSFNLTLHLSCRQTFLIWQRFLKCKPSFSFLVFIKMFYLYW